MSATKHTRGQWRVFGARAEGGTSNEIRVDGKLIARVFMNGNPLEREANARLIAAAPELLRALQALLQNPTGCAFCDSGKPRKSVQTGEPCEHEDQCGFVLARGAKAKALGDAK